MQSARDWRVITPLLVMTLLIYAVTIYGFYVAISTIF